MAIRYPTVAELQEAERQRIFGDKPSEPQPVSDLARDERAEMIHEMVTSAPWQRVAVPALKAHLAGLERKLALGTGMPPESMRVVQGQCVMLMLMLDDPRKFFGAERDDG